MPRFEPVGHDLGHLAGVVVGGGVAHAGEGLVNPVVAEPEVVLALLADEHERVVPPLGLGVHQLPLGGLDHRAVVRPGQAPVRCDDHEPHPAHRLPPLQQRVRGLSPAGGHVLDHVGELRRIGPGGVGPVLGLNHPSGGDQLHRAGDLLGGLHRRNPSAQRALLTSGHYSPPEQRPARRQSATWCAPGMDQLSSGR